MPILPSEYGDKEINELRGESVLLLTKTANKMGITDVENMSPHSVKQMKKDTVCELLYDALRFLEEFTGVVSTDFKVASNSVKHHTTDSQQMILKLQSVPMACNNEQLESLQTSVKSSRLNSNLTARYCRRIVQNLRNLSVLK